MFTNHTWEFEQTYNLGAVGVKDSKMNSVAFEVKRSKVNITTRPEMINKYLFKHQPLPQSHIGQRFAVENHLVTYLILQSFCGIRYTSMLTSRQRQHFKHSL